MLTTPIPVFNFGRTADELNQSELINLNVNFTRPVETLDDWVDAGLENMPSMYAHIDAQKAINPQAVITPTLYRYGQVKRFYEQEDNIIVEFQETLSFDDEPTSNTFTLNLETTASVNIPTL